MSLDYHSAVFVLNLLLCMPTSAAFVSLTATHRDQIKADMSNTAPLSGMPGAKHAGI